jgi:UDP-N-acetylglucosamine 2-epimerase (non-hydrolysing)
LRILTILGTRPEIIRLSRVVPRLDDALGRDNHLLVHTGQNSDPTLSANFFDELGMRQPDHNFGALGTVAEQLATIFVATERFIDVFRPDCVLILGDTNSSLAAIIAARAGIPVYHMEAGNRSYSSRSPEEVNRRLIDHCSAVLLPYTERSRGNLLAEGIHSSRIFVTGNPIWEVIEHYQSGIDRSDIFNKLEITRGEYFLVTLHRAENIDTPSRLWNFVHVLDLLSKEYKLPIIVSAHPHLAQKAAGFDWTANPIVNFHSPFGFFDFISLQRSAFCVLSDSGTVQEECAILGVPMVCLRDHTERPECLEAGASVLSGADPVAILSAVRLVTERRSQWTAPAEYLRENVSETVVRILLGHREGSLL